ncbi:Protein yippee-like [Vitis vinifera]|uniref:Protein yippee-like n=1 Tax=Vitis vinifera TaxID=29760 RepID=A0A438BV66_VITVI|nr:Protein yippee-like [Vitis vinifera]
MNVNVGPKEDRHLMTGLHTVADVFCCDCCQVLGWKYERAYEESQKYKEGKFILEKSKIVKENCVKMLPSSFTVMDISQVTDVYAVNYCEDVVIEPELYLKRRECCRRFK